jgi:hypothetical protein
MVLSAVLVVLAGGIPFVLDIWVIEFREFGPAGGTVMMIPIIAWSLIFLPLESNSLEVLSGVDAPLFVLVHNAPVAFFAQFGEKLTAGCPKSRF